MIKKHNRKIYTYKYISWAAAAALTTVSFDTPTSLADEIPPGFHQTPDGTIVANDPATASVPQGYYLRRNGTLIKLGGQMKTTDALIIPTTGSVVAQNNVPPGFHQTPDGKIMANDPETAVAPPGYYLRRNGSLIKLNPAEIDLDATTITPSLAPGEIPPGFSKMPDGRIMADDPKTAVVPPGYHLMPNGQLMSNTGMGGGSGHHHGKGMWMLDYKFSRMYMKDMLDTTKKVTAEQAVAADDYNYMMAPVDMTMDMHMIMIMYGITENIMPMLMLHYMSNSMGMLTSDGTTSTMKSSGIADTVALAMIQGPYQLNFNVGLSIPTGSIDKGGPMTHGQGATVEQKYGYGMQMGSGSYDLKLGISYEKLKDKFGWGGSYEYTARLNKNKHDYKLGNVLLLDGWLEYGATSFISAKGKMQLRSVGRIDGVDAEIEEANVMGDGRIMSPIADASSYGGNRIDASASLRFTIPNTMFSITTDFTIPIYQNLWGPQMATRWIASINFGWMKH